MKLIIGPFLIVTREGLIKEFELWANQYMKSDGQGGFIEHPALAAIELFRRFLFR